MNKKSNSVLGTDIDSVCSDYYTMQDVWFPNLQEFFQDNLKEKEAEKAQVKIAAISSYTF